MLINYRGGRVTHSVSYGRRMFHFNQSNNHTLDIKEEKIIDYFFHPMHNSQFRTIERESSQEVNIIKKEVVESKKGFSYGQKKL